MVDNRSDLESELRGWLHKGSAVLADTRKFLGSDPNGKRPGLRDSQIANWWRKDRLPDTFVEGAALYHCAQERKRRLDAAQRTGIAGESFWQVFVVHAPKTDGQEKLHCTIMRYWQGVRALNDRKPHYLTHIAHRSADREADRKKPRQLGREDDSFDYAFDANGGVFVSWELGREPLDYGYEVVFGNAIVNDHDEAVGGLSTIQVGSAHMLVFLPQKAVDRLAAMLLPGNPQGLPGALSTLVNGSPVDVMESYLGIRKGANDRDYRRLGPWFEPGPQVAWGLGDRAPPQAIREQKAFEAAVESAKKGECRPCSTHVDDPAPFLSYMMVF